MEYYAGPDLWVSGLQDAMAFPSLAAATGMIGTKGLPKGCCLVVVRFHDDEDYDLTFEI